MTDEGPGSFCRGWERRNKQGFSSCRWSSGVSFSGSLASVAEHLHGGMLKCPTEVKAGGYQVQGQPGLQSWFKDSLGNLVRFCLKRKKKMNERLVRFFSG